MKILVEEYSAKDMFNLKNPFRDELNKVENNEVTKIVYMTPKEYLTEVASFFDRTPEEHIKSVSKSHGMYYTAKEIEELARNQHITFDAPYINYTTEMQEGNHRIYAAGELFGWNTKFPVFVHDYADKKLAEEQKKKQKEYETKKHLEQIVSTVIGYNYNNMEEFSDELEYQVNREYNIFHDEEPVKYKLDVDDSNYYLTIDGVTEEIPIMDIKLKDEDDIEDTDIDVDADDSFIDDIDFNDKNWFEKFL